MILLYNAWIVWCAWNVCLLLETRAIVWKWDTNYLGTRIFTLLKFWSRRWGRCVTSLFWRILWDSCLNWCLICFLFRIRWKCWIFFNWIVICLLWNGILLIILTILTLIVLSWRIIYKLTRNILRVLKCLILDALRTVLFDLLSLWSIIIQIIKTAILLLNILNAIILNLNILIINWLIIVTAVLSYIDFGIK